MLTSFVREPDLALDLDRRWYLLWHPDLRWNMVDSMVVAHSRLAFGVLRLWDVVCAEVASGSFYSGKTGEGAGGERGEHSLPGALQDRTALYAVIAVLAEATGGGRAGGHGGGEEKGQGARAAVGLD